MLLNRCVITVFSLKKGMNDELEKLPLKRSVCVIKRKVQQIMSSLVCNSDLLRLLAGSSAARHDLHCSDVLTDSK